MNSRTPSIADCATLSGPEVLPSGVHLDANASYGMLPGLVEAVGKELPPFQNASSIHQLGQRARAALEVARTRVARLIGAEKGDAIIFTSGATEANGTVIGGAGWDALCSSRDLGEITCGDVASSNTSSIAFGAVEHPSVREAAQRWEEVGVPVWEVGVNELRSGQWSPASLARLPQTRLIALMKAHNESGELFAVEPLFSAARQLAPQSLWLHCDAVQLLGKSVVEWRRLGADSISISAHKIGGFPGIGALVVREGRAMRPWQLGGAQETRMRGGTENLPGIVAFGLAAEWCAEHLDQRVAQMAENTEYLRQGLSQIVGVSLNFAQEVCHRLPNTVSVAVPGIRADDLLVALDLRGFYVSTGSACSSGKPESSLVLEAYGLPKEIATSTIRISLRGTESSRDLDRFVRTFAATVQSMGKRKVGNIGSAELLR